MNGLRIAHVDTQMTWRGGERQALELIKGLEVRGQNNVVVCKPGSEIEKRARTAGIRVVNIRLSGEWDIVSAYKLRSLVKREAINILHTHTSHAHTIGLLASVGLHDCKLVVSRRVDFHVNNMFSRKIKYGESVDKIISVSDAIRRILIEDGIDPDRVTTVRSGFITGEFGERGSAGDLRKELNIPKESIVVVTVAALAPHKSLHDLLKAAHIVLKKHPDVKFLIAGEGETRNSLEKNIVNLKLENSVILLGFIDNIASVYETGSIFALSSREEGLCTSLLDAMYFGLPVVATSAGGIPEIVQDEVNGLIVPVGDYMLFAEKLAYLIENPDRCEKMGLRSNAILEQNTIEGTIDKTLAVYRSLFRNRTGCDTEKKGV